MSTSSKLAEHGFPLDEHGFPLDVVLRIWYLVIGLAAVVVRPWSLYVLFACLALIPVWGGLYVAFVASDWQNRIFVALATVPMTVLPLGYFYKRRAMFRARGRWRRLERWCPGLVGPETHSPDRVPGFAGLSNPRRLFFVAILAALILRDKIDGVEGSALAVVILLALLLFVRRIKELESR